MTTQLINADFSAEVMAFLERSAPCNPVPFAYALADGTKSNGTDWIRRDEARAILHTLNMMAYGQSYKIDAIKEHNRLEIIFRK